MNCELSFEKVHMSTQGINYPRAMDNLLYKGHNILHDSS